MHGGDSPWLTAGKGTPRARTLSSPTSHGHARAACCESMLSARDLHRHFPSSAIDQRALLALDGLMVSHSGEFRCPRVGGLSPKGSSSGRPQVGNGCGGSLHTAHADVSSGIHPGPDAAKGRTSCLQIADHQSCESPPCSNRGP